MIALCANCFLHILHGFNSDNSSSKVPWMFLGMLQCGCGLGPSDLKPTVNAFCVLNMTAILTRHRGHCYLPIDCYCISVCMFYLLRLSLVNSIELACYKKRQLLSLVLKPSSAVSDVSESASVSVYSPPPLPCLAWVSFGLMISGSFSYDGRCIRL